MRRPFDGVISAEGASRRRAPSGCPCGIRGERGPVDGSQVAGRRDVSSHRRPTLVTVISENRETVDGLHSYLTRAGVESRGARGLGETSRLPRGTTAVVIFPDDFEPEDVLRAVASLRAALPATLIVLVTAQPQPFLAAPSGPTPASTLVLPKPVFGWTILDAIRSHQDPALA